MVSIAIFAMISLALFSLFSSILQSIRRNKAILAANSVMTEQMEIVRGMDYDDVTTVAGFIDGKLPNSEDVTRSGIAFTISRDISMVDDPYDGIGAPADLFEWDYKQVRITLTWKDPVTGSDQVSTAVTNVVPEGLEGLEEGKGGIYITVFDADGEGVSDASVRIKSTKAPYELLTGLTDANGNLWISTLNPADDYRVIVTKADYSLERTYAINNNDTTPECDPALFTCNPYNPSPVKRDLRVVDQKVTRAGFAIDRLGSLKISTVRLSSMVNWHVNYNRPGEQWDPSGTLALSADPLHPYLFAVFTDTRDAKQHIYLQKLAYNSTSGKYEKLLANDVKITNYVTSLDIKAQNAIIKTSPKDNSVWVVWDDESAGAGDNNVYLQQINTSTGAPTGTRYTVNRNVPVGSAPPGTKQMDPDIEIDHDGNIYIVWEDNRSGNWDIYMQKKDGTSGNFLAQDRKVNDDDESANEQLNPKIVADGDMEGTANSNNTYVVWQSNHNGDFDVYIQKYSKNVTKNGDTKKVNDTDALDQYEPDVAYDGSSSIYVAWTDERNSEPDIYFQKLSKNCDRLLTAPGDVLVNDDTFTYASRTKPSIAYSGPSAIYVTWEDSRNGLPYYTTYTSKVNSEGARQWAYDFMASDTYQSIQTDPFTLVDPEGYAITLWGDSREEADDSSIVFIGWTPTVVDMFHTDDIFGSRYSTMGNTTLTNIPVKITSENYIGTSLTDKKIPKYEEIFYSDGSGLISTGNIIEWGDYIFSTADGSGYYVESTNPPMPLAVFPLQEASIMIDVKP